MLMHALNDRGRETLAQARKRFAHRYDALRADAYNDLPAGIVRFLEEELRPEMGTELAACDELLAYSHGSRGFEVSKYAVQYFIAHLVSDYAQQLNDTETMVLRLRVLEDQAWTAIASELGLSGRDEVQRTLRQAVARLVEQSNDPEVSSELECWKSQAS